MLAARLEKLRAPTLVSVALGVVASLVVIGLRSAGFFQFVELASYDIYLRLKERHSVPEPRVVLIQTVEEDIQKLAEWPLSDRRMVEVLQRLLAYEPSAIGVDLYRDIPVPPGTDDLTALLASDKRVVVIEKFAADSSKRVAGPAVLRGTEQIGFSDVTVDDDGVVRRGLLFLDDGENFSVSLALRLALAYLAKRFPGRWGSGAQTRPTPATPAAPAPPQQVNVLVVDRDELQDAARQHLDAHRQRQVSPVVSTGATADAAELSGGES